MRYVKPTVTELNGRAASGSSINDACMAGGAVKMVSCVSGLDDASCYTGVTGVGTGSDCKSGSAAGGFGACLPGGAAGWDCATGGAPSQPAIACSTGSAA